MDTRYRDDRPFSQVEFDEACALSKTKSAIENYRSLEWNTSSNWAIPLPEYRIDGYLVSRHFVPDEAPVIPTGWLYTDINGKIHVEYRLYSGGYRQLSEDEYYDRAFDELHDDTLSNDY